MDTNVLRLIESLQMAQKASNALPGVGVSVLMILMAAAPTLAALAAYFKAKAGLNNTEETRKSAQYMAESVEKVHRAVNSEREAMLLEVKTLRDEILRICTEKAVLEHRLMAMQRKEAAASPEKAPHLRPPPP